MKAIYYEQFQGPLSIASVVDPRPSPEGVVIAVKASGLCLSDWHGWMGHDPDIRLPHVPGHELAGEIVSVGTQIRSFRKGDRVTVPFVSGCGHCRQCQSGNQQICDHQFQPGFTAWGSFAEYVAIDYAEHNLVRLPETISFDTAASLGCRFATAFRAVVDQGRLGPGEWLAVFGCGGLGLSALMIAKALGAQTIAIDIRREALQLAQTLGATHCLHAPSIPDISQAIKELTKGGVHLSLDAIGKRDIVAQSVASLRKRGRHVQVGILPPEQAFAPIPFDQIIAMELEIYGSHGMQAYRYPEMINMIEQGVLEPEKLIYDRLDLTQAAALFTSLHQQNTPGIRLLSPH